MNRREFIAAACALPFFPKPVPPASLVDASDFDLPPLVLSNIRGWTVYNEKTGEVLADGLISFRCDGVERIRIPTEATDADCISIKPR